MRPHPACKVCPQGTDVGNLCDACFRQHVESLTGRVVFLEAQLLIAEAALFELNLTVERMLGRKAAI